MNKDDSGGNSGSTSLRSPEPVPVSAHSGDDPGRAINHILGPGGPLVSHEDALNAAHDLIAHFFKNEPRKGGGVLISIPVRPDNTDVLLIRYIRQQQAKESNSTPSKGRGARQ